MAFWKANPAIWPKVVEPWVQGADAWPADLVAEDLRWMADQLWMFVPAQQVLGKFLATFKEFPQRQPVGSLSVEKVLEQMESQSPTGR